MSLSLVTLPGLCHSTAQPIVEMKKPFGLMGSEGAEVLKGQLQVLIRSTVIPRMYVLLNIHNSEY